MASESFPPKNIQSFQEQLLINPRPCFPPEPLVAESSFLARKFELTRKFTDLAPKSSYFFFYPFLLCRGQGCLCDMEPQISVVPEDGLKAKQKNPSAVGSQAVVVKGLDRLSREHTRGGKVGFSESGGYWGLRLHELWASVPSPTGVQDGAGPLLVERQGGGQMLPPSNPEHFLYKW